MELGRVTTGLAELAPGPELSAALAAVDPSEVANGELLTVLRARARQLAHDDARFLAVIAEIGRADPTAELDEIARLGEPTRYGADETRAALAWTRRAAEAEHDLAEVLLHQLPLVFTALDTGHIMRAKARVFADHLAGLSAADIDRICRALLPKAPGLTTGQLRTRLARLVIAAAPGRARDQYEKAVTERSVIGYLNPDGTAVITAEGLPPDQAASACARIDQLARAAKHAGHLARLDQIRADIFLGLLDGRYHQHTRTQIIKALLRNQQHTQATAQATQPDQTQPSPANPTGPTRTEPTPANPTNPADPGPAAGIEVRVELSTLLGHDDHPGEIPGWGPIPAHVARRAVARQRRAQWRYAITNPHGHLLREGITRRRPTHTRNTTTGGIVELHIPATLLTELADHPERAGDWASVITDIAAQYARGEPDLEGPTRRRFPTAAQRRHVHIRDRTCRGPGCRHPATTSQIDHTHDYRHGGPTTPSNTDPLCNHDHDLKTKGGWRLHQSQPGSFHWHSPLGGTYHIRGDPIISPLFEPEDDDPPF